MPSSHLQAMRQLESRMDDVRAYYHPTANYTIVTDQYDQMRRHHVAPACIEPSFNESSRILRTSDMAVDGPGAQLELADAWGITLPSDYVAFCNRFSEYVLVARNVIWLMPAWEIERITEALRGGADIDPDTEHHVFRFAEVLGEQAHYLFRWSPDRKKSDVVFSYYSESTELALTGPDGDDYICDTSFTGWLSRLIATDGSPLRPGRTDEIVLPTRVE